VSGLVANKLTLVIASAHESERAAKRQFQKYAVVLIVFPFEYGAQRERSPFASAHAK